MTLPVPSKFGYCTFHFSRPAENPGCMVTSKRNASVETGANVSLSYLSFRRRRDRWPPPASTPRHPYRGRARRRARELLRALYRRTSRPPPADRRGLRELILDPFRLPFFRPPVEVRAGIAGRFRLLAIVYGLGALRDAFATHPLPACDALTLLFMARVGYGLGRAGTPRRGSRRPSHLCRDSPNRSTGWP